LFTGISIDSSREDLDDNMSPSLRRVLFVDFLGALSTVIVLIGAATPLAPHLGLSTTTLRAVGVLLVPYVVFVLQAARSNATTLARLRAIVAFNATWFLASMLLLALGTHTVFGAWLITLQALLVVPLIFFELRADRRDIR